MDAALSVPLVKVELTVTTLVLTGDSETLLPLPAKLPGTTGAGVP